MALRLMARIEKKTQTTQTSPIPTSTHIYLIQIFAKHNYTHIGIKLFIII